MLALVALAALPAWGAEAAEPSIEIGQEGAALTATDLSLTLGLAGLPEGEPVEVGIFAGGRQLTALTLAPGEHTVQVEHDLPAGRHTIAVEAAGQRAEHELRFIPGWLSILPPLLAIGLALAFKDVIVSLFIGVFGGAMILFNWNPFVSFARTIDHFVAPNLADTNQAKIILFTTLLGGMVGVISRSGGTRGIVEWLAPLATTSKRGQLATWALGVFIFFDDYANTLIVGNTMRPITDRLKISREKLAYVVDSTAAPVACIMPISTWVGFEIGLIGAAFATLELQFSPYTTFLSSIPYRFYPIFALVLGFTIAYSQRDLGPMWKAERRARTTGKVLGDGDVPLANFDNKTLEPPPGAPLRAANAFLPILTVIGMTAAGLWISGSGQVVRAAGDSTGRWVQEVLSAADSYDALMWASGSGLLVAILLPLAQKILTLRQTMEGMVEGFKSMIMAFTVLVLAWSIGSVCSELNTAAYVVGLTEGFLSPYWLPTLTFILAAAVAFATGSSWGTMAILTPLVIPISHGLSTASGFGVETEQYFIFLVGTVSSVLAGSVWGDHCSPISDTTILSSLSSGCDHIAHVRTQMPYALAIGFLGMLLGDIPTAYGLSPWVSILLGIAVIVIGVRWLGRRTDAAA